MISRRGRLRVTWSVAQPADARTRAPANAAGASPDKPAPFTSATRECSADELAKGINLAAAFLDNPFSEPFRKVEEKIARQQERELWLVKTLMHTLPDYERALPEEKESLKRIADGLISKSQALRKESAAAVAPVRHVIRVQPVE